ncbi:peptidoglycan-binding domain-containing protein [Nostoc sp. DedQUE07]|uniref:peptidoglycan-binding domain-containing protein n=1 Tax=Nostoc sp. DedQUE07 TaxID=3075392 RepID=UPI002AD200FE|nr:peptidoglycan-binding domain-containing protein [Nostoc sp. DedQUE07]MDZ8131883.1 peptidoglycan-binding domain-containing protein [Nostoc sp. DedQUE07]
MKLQDFKDTSTKLGFEAINKDRELAGQIQEQLINLGLLDAPADGRFGPISTATLQTFQKKLSPEEVGFLSSVTAQNLLEAKPEDFRTPIKFGSDFASRILKYMQAKGYQVFSNNQEYNIVYIEGLNADGTLNNDAPNVFNDRRIVIEVVDGVPKIAGNWEATSEPGSYYTYHPINAGGAARIQFGQYKAWAVGIHGNAEPHEALVQVRDITVCRDFNKDGTRTGDKLDTGLFAVNQHWGYDYPANDINNASAGCLVGRTRQGHREFMSLAKRDRRYKANNGYIFYATVIPGDDFVKSTI